MRTKARCPETCTKCHLSDLAARQTAVSKESLEITARRLSIWCPLGHQPVAVNKEDNIKSNGAR